MGKEFGAMKLNKDGLHVGENANACCYCIEINIGVMIIGVLIIISAAIDLYDILSHNYILYGDEY